MSNVTCDALLISCIDFRLQKFIKDWADQNLGVGNYDNTEIAGGVKDDFEALKQLEISADLHKIQKVVAIAHEDCGAYGDEGSKDQLVQDLQDFKSKVGQLHPGLAVELYYLQLDGQIEAV